MKRTAVLLFVVFILAACGGKKEVKQASPESVASAEAFALAETIREAFVKNDRVALQKNSTADGYRDITASKKGFDQIELAFTPRWVEISGSQLNLNVSWKSAWTNAGRKVEDRGMAVFVMEGKPLKVSKILRANPFIYPEQ
ncbi:MAG: hypothetical protein EPN25_09800 [Nitrospirae bacterium]|nr:MAG: hypothetical protein EPN25_09800 [Nitrospirota bacterium]